MRKPKTFVGVMPSLAARKHAYNAVGGELVVIGSLIKTASYNGDLEIEIPNNNISSTGIEYLKSVGYELTCINGMCIIKW